MGGQIDVILADLDNYTEGEVVALAMNINANLRDNPPIGTPIDTGWASANWIPAIGTPFQDPGAGGEPSESEISSRASMASQGLNDLLSYRLSDGPVFSSNNVPYIVALNEGHSDQSPSGFVQAAIERAVNQTGARAARRSARQGRASSYRSSKRTPRT